MFRFFRQIRQNLLTQESSAQGNTPGRAGRYLLYAVGEVILVVIGILIALQVNNWNNDRLQQKAAKAFYSNTRQQLLEDRTNIEGQIAYNNQHRAQFEYAFDVIGQDDHSVADSLAAITGKLIDYSDFDQQGNLYETIVSSGDVKLLENDEIKGRLRLLEQTYLYINRMEEIHYDAIMSSMPILIATINMPSKSIIDEEALYHPTFQNLFSLSLRIIDEKHNVYLRAISEIDSLVSFIEEEINRF